MPLSLQKVTSIQGHVEKYAVGSVVNKLNKLDLTERCLVDQCSWDVGGLQDLTESVCIISGKRKLGSTIVDIWDQFSMCCSWCMVLSCLMSRNCFSQFISNTENTQVDCYIEGIVCFRKETLGKFRKSNFHSILCFCRCWFMLFNHPLAKLLPWKLQ